MSLTQALNSKANVKQFTNQDLPFNAQQPVIAAYYATSTANQTAIVNLGFSIDQANTDTFFLFVDGKLLRLGSANDYTFTGIDSNNTSSSIGFVNSLTAGLNIQAFKLGLKKESEFQTDNRFTQLFEAQDSGFQGFVNTQTLMTATAATGSPAAGLFHSTVVNRAPIIDLSQDLKSRMGGDRWPIQQLYVLSNEVGPAGEQVFKNVNDTFDQIRFVGFWGINNLPNNSGQYAITGSAGSYMEFTFYGTGLNIGIVPVASMDFNYAVDGGAESANLALAYSTVIDGRNYNSNTIIPIVSGLTLGVHTVRVKNNAASAGLRLNLVEALNESSDVKTNSGNAYTKGQKLTLAAQDSTSYTSGVTGARGGRTLTYLTGTTLNRAFQAVNATQQNLTSADHTSEELVKDAHWREFGAGRADDFSTNLVTATVAFTLEDGTTSLVGSSVTSGVASNTDYISPATTSSFLTITFVGTGLDVLLAGTGTVFDNHTVSVDGTNITTTFVGSTNNVVRKIVSGLPYGTHVVSFLRTATGNTGIAVSKFMIYQPKKPALPDGSVEISDFNVMANFAANSTAGVNNLATGVLRKTGTREMTYVNGTGGTTNWTLSLPDVTQVSATRFSTDRQNAFVQYSFFGTGFDLRFLFSTSRTTSATITANGLTLNTTNFPSLAANTYGVLAKFNTATGVLDQSNGSQINAAGLSVSGLTLGLYTIRITNNTTSILEFQGFDVVCPIHSYKSNLYYDLQNTLPVGSQSISDNRKLTPIKDIHLQKKNVAQAFGVTSNPTTNSTIPVPMPDMNVVHVNNSGKIKISYSGTFYSSGTNGNILCYIYVDGYQVGTNKKCQVYQNLVVVTISDVIELNVSPGAHKVELYWSANATFTSTADATNRNLLVEEK